MAFLDEPDLDEPPKRLGRFEILSILGRGGMGTVYLAQDPVIGRQVAIKEIKIGPEVDDDGREELHARFEQEFRSAGTLTHPNVVTIYDVGETTGAYFIAMEYVAGESLAQRLRRDRQPSFARVSHLAHQIAAGLDYAHGRGIVHRDVKPGNILLGDHDEAKISDFGIAKFLTSDLTQTGIVLGTPAFMSPEQARGKLVDGRADQFSFAVILYRMLTGEQPFWSDHPSTTLYRIIHEPPTMPCERNPDLPAAVDEVLMHALAKEPEGRYESCRQLARALTAALGVAAPEGTAAVGGVMPATVRLESPATRPVTIEPAGTAGLTATPGATPRRWRGPAIVAAVLAVALAGALIVASGAFRRAPDNTAPDAMANGAAASGDATAETATGGAGIDGETSAGGDGAPAANGDAGGGGDDPMATDPAVDHRLEVLTSAGDGAQIFRDGEDTGLVAPASVPVAGTPGTAVRLELRRGDESIANRELELARDPPEPWQPAVTPQALILQVTSEPAGARVLLDGREVGTTPYRHAFEHGPSYDLRLEAEGFKAAGWRFALADLSAAQLRARRLHFPLDSSVPPALLAVTAPYPVTVMVGGRRFGPGKKLEIPLPPDRYRVELVAEDVFLRQTYPVALKSGERQALQAPAAVAVRISAQPSSCTMTIDGRALDDSMPVTLRLAVGRYTFRFAWPDGRTRRVVKTISPATKSLFVTPE